MDSSALAADEDDVLASAEFVLVVGPYRVLPAAAAHGVAHAVRGVDHIGAGPSNDRVLPIPAGDSVLARAATELVVPAAAGDPVVALIAADAVRASRSG